MLDSLSSGVVVSILSMAQSVNAVCIALSFIHFKYSKSATFEQILLELNLITDNLGGDSVIKAAKISSLIGGASALSPIVIGILCQAYVHIETILMDAFGMYATLLMIFTQICKVILVANICSELYQIINSKLKVICVYCEL
jgi:mannose/fructose/N-acetylgalactosamine-specific phosphotransferase system component IID